MCLGGWGWDLAEEALDHHRAAAPGDDDCCAQIRAPVKKQSSMQKLITKMKEIRLKVTGKGE